MDNKVAQTIEAVIDYIEEHLDTRLDLDRISSAVHYSKFHLHRLFAGTVGMTIHDYVQRRQLTEAAKMLVFSEMSILDIAILCGYESQQAFTMVFKAMYKTPPAEYREKRVFYPLQLRFTLEQSPVFRAYSKEDICHAQTDDIPAWMELMRLAIDGYPVMDEHDYLREITRAIDENRALVLRGGTGLIGAMAFSAQTGSIDFLGIHPQYRNQGIQRLFLDALLEKYLPGREITMTTFREGDRADTGHRALLKQLGFAERELLVEFGYPTQRFALSPDAYEEKEQGYHAEQQE